MLADGSVVREREDVSSQTIWGIHAGRTGDAHNLFLSKSVVALGWVEMGDLSVLPASRDAFKVAVAKNYPHHKPGAIPNNAGQLFRFVHEMKQGDLVVYPSKSDRQIHIGEVTGDYVYDPQSAAYPHLRSVNWLKIVPRLKFSQGALYEIGAAMSFFQIKNYADEFLAVVEGKLAELVSDDEEEAAVAQVQAAAEESTHDFIIKTLARKLKGHPLADFVAHLLNAMGYKTRVSPEGTDGGVDIIAHTDELGFQPPIIKVQVKSSESGSVGDPVVKSLYGNVAHGEYGLFVTLGTFSNPARQFERGKSNLRLIDGAELVNLILSHYDQFDSRYKGILPLKRVYVPDSNETIE
jgi:restriction system protein